ncbi:MAG: prepilin-type N-terminal cleavage/methylation domain-containing protein [Gammaproteobacteria bacterium]|jgi:type II secretion system protein H|nr:prepilin-type N-terminal cleavage/methylation domain-containing protein [Gammaproteobacteria bacterium]MBT4810853.1 prepilin-type N-terminal cleavage/methylation domain-containing protein [Thiotrichales bacterium]MBT5634815.1 prepilin-type N-terminal cleavage/methylation domain-containing protein [Gammaproteobacteria bacterium]MBT5687966.1 prepilin-type N-terminal cleavage/methylation domain-containing protein [Gammaproteobacteria bacterium]
MGRERGFTLIELLVVLMLVGLLVGLAVPKLFNGQQEQLRKEALHFSRVLQWALDQSLYSGSLYRLQIDYAEQHYQIEQENEGEGGQEGEQESKQESKQETFSVVSETLVKPHTMEKTAVRFEADTDQMGWLDESVQRVSFTPFGASGPLSIHFLLQGEEQREGFRVWLNRSEGRVELEPF